jgi:dihydroxyacid dehydratase/phosphogluconate dehydratase
MGVDVNHFRDAGGMSAVIAQLLMQDLHNDVETVVGTDNYIVGQAFRVVHSCLIRT